MSKIAGCQGLYYHFTAKCKVVEMVDRHYDFLDTRPVVDIHKRLVLIILINLVAGFLDTRFIVSLNTHCTRTSQLAMRLRNTQTIYGHQTSVQWVGLVVSVHACTLLAYLPTFSVAKRKLFA